MFITTFRYRIRPEMMPLYANLQKRFALREQRWGSTATQYLQNRADLYQWMEIHTYPSEEAYHASQNLLRNDSEAAALWNEFLATMDPSYPALVEEFSTPAPPEVSINDDLRKARPTIVLAHAADHVPPSSQADDAVDNDAVDNGGDALADTIGVPPEREARSASDSVAQENELNESAENVVVENPAFTNSGPVGIESPSAIPDLDETFVLPTASVVEPESPDVDPTPSHPTFVEDELPEDDELADGDASESLNGGSEAETIEFGGGTMIPIADGVFEVTNGPSSVDPIETGHDARDDSSESPAIPEEAAADDGDISAEEDSVEEDLADWLEDLPVATDSDDLVIHDETPSDDAPSDDSPDEFTFDDEPESERSFTVVTPPDEDPGTPASDFCDFGDLENDVADGEGKRPADDLHVDEIVADNSGIAELETRHDEPFETTDDETSIADADKPSPDDSFDDSLPGDWIKRDL